MVKQMMKILMNKPKEKNWFQNYELNSFKKTASNLLRI